MAKLIFALHVAVVLFLALGIPLVLIGWRRRWRFVRSTWLRTLHLALAAYVAANTAAGNPCPLTVWEDRLLREAGAPGYGADDFTTRHLGRALHREVTMVQGDRLDLLLGAAVFLLYALVPPRWFLHKTPAPKEDRAQSGS